MSSSSLSVNTYDPSEEIPYCECRPRMLAKERESWRDKNPARRFFNCSNSLTDRSSCNFFKWKDHTLNSHYKNTILKMKRRLAAIDAACKSLEVAHLLNNLLAERAKRQTNKDSATQTIKEVETEYDNVVTRNAELESEKLLLEKKLLEMEDLVAKLNDKNKFMGRLVTFLVVVVLVMVIGR